MSTVLLDTSVASLLHPKKKNSTLRAQYAPHMTGHVLSFSFQLTLARVRGGVRCAPWDTSHPPLSSGSPPD